MMRVGSEMSPLEMVFLRSGLLEDDDDPRVEDAKVEDIGVLAPESGGVMLEAKGEVGVGRPDGV